LNDHIARTREETQRQTTTREQFIRESQKKDNHLLQKEHELNEYQMRSRKEIEKQTTSYYQLKEQFQMHEKSAQLNIKTLEDKLAALNEKEKAFLQSLLQKEKEIQVLKVDIEQKRTAQNNLTVQISQKDQSYTALTVTNTKLQQEKSSLQANIESLRQEKQTLQHTITSLQSETQSLRTKLTKYTGYEEYTFSLLPNRKPKYVNNSHFATSTWLLKSEQRFGIGNLVTPEGGLFKITKI